MASILEQLGLSSDQVLSSDNIASTITPTEDTGALGILNAQNIAAGVDTAQTAYNTAQANYLSGQNLANQEQVTIEGRAKKLGVLRGEQAQAAQQANVDLQTLLSAQTLAGNTLASAQNTATNRANILINEYQQKNDLLLQYPGLDIDPLTDSFDKISEKLEEYQEDMAKDAEKAAYKEALRDMGLSTKGSRGELEDRLKDANASLYAQTKKEAELNMKKLELSVQQAQKNLSDEGGSSSTTTPSLTKITEDGKTYLYNEATGEVTDPLGVVREEDGALFEDEEESFWDKLQFWK